MLPILKIMLVLKPPSKKLIKSGFIQVTIKPEVLRNNPMIGTKWGLALYMWKERKYSLIPLSIILEFLFLFYKRERLVGKISESIYEMD